MRTTGEHKTINAYEAGAELTLASVDQYSTRHTRCGDRFLLVVVVIFILLSTFLGRPALLLRLVTRILLIPIVSGLAYEWIKFSARHYKRSAVVRPRRARTSSAGLSTRKPDQEMLQVAIAALQAVLESEQGNAVTIATQ